MDQGPLVIQEIDAGAEFARAFDRYAPVKVAFWLKASDNDYRYLYIASDQVDDSNFDLAYGEVVRLADQMQSMYLDPFRIRVIGADHPLARAAVEVHRRFPGRLATRLGDTRFGGVTVDDVYLYPSPLPAAVA